MPQLNTLNVSGLSWAGRVGGVMAPVFGKVVLAARGCPGQLTDPRQRAKPEGHAPGKS